MKNFELPLIDIYVCKFICFHLKLIVIHTFSLK